jgi:subfamily B ATP-binding cassette protein MsbA
MSDINSILYESFSGIHIIKAFDMSQYEKDKFKDKNQSFYRYLVKEAKRLAVVNPITEYISVCAALVVVYLSARMIIIKGFDPGVFTAFMIVLFQLVDPVKKLSKVHLINQQALAAATRLYKILDTETDIKENPEAKILTKFEKDIEFKKVSFKYDDKEVLKDINLRVSKGNRVAIVGRSGVGKTTLVNLIPRFYDPTKGKILIDGIDLKDVTLASLRKHMGIVTQDTILFNDTVKANIAYGDINASFERIKKAAKVANAHNFIKELPKGYDTTIGDRGFKLSGGEKQRIAIARAILKNPAILILDEATSQLDTESEQLVQEALDHLIKGRTTFVIAHRLSTAQGASFIVVLDKGKILELNTHKELMEKGGLYRKLYNLQFEDVG